MNALIYGNEIDDERIAKMIEQLYCAMGLLMEIYNFTSKRCSDCRITRILAQIVKFGIGDLELKYRFPDAKKAELKARVAEARRTATEEADRSLYR